MLGASDPRLAAHAQGKLPAWLWSADGTRILWANPAGLDVFSARDGARLTEKIFGPADPHRRQIAQLAGRLKVDGAVRMERLRGFGAAPGALVTCSCARLDFADGSHGLLVAAALFLISAAGSAYPEFGLGPVGGMGPRALTPFILYRILCGVGVGIGVVGIVAGTVTFAGWDSGGYGNLVVIDHAKGVSSWYAHLSRLDVTSGAAVTTASQVGLVGATGNATGPHLHWGMNWFDVRLDPLLVVGAPAN